MSMNPDPAEVLRFLADCLDVQRTLEAFPGLTGQGLAAMLQRAAGEPGMAVSAVVHVDGAARGNPGQAGAGIVLEGPDGILLKKSEYLGESTNNVAEYKAVVLGMEAAAGLGVDDLTVRSDSELVVRQLNGEYRVKNPQLQDLYFSAIKAASSFSKVTFTHVPRGENREADRLANMAIDAKKSVTL